jgi:hypothetical protein
MRYREVVEEMSQGSLPAASKVFVLSRDNYTCQMCGATTTDLDPYERKQVRLQVGFRVPLSEGGNSAAQNLRTLCSSCAEGLETAPYIPRPAVSDLLKLLLRCSPSDIQTLQASLSRSLQKHF